MPDRTRPPFESVVGDLFADRARVRTLIAGALVLLAAGLDPRIWAPQLTTVQAAVRAQPSLDQAILLLGLIAAIVVLVGGAIGDLARARPIIRGGLVVLLVTAIAGLVLPTDGTAFELSRVFAVVAESLVFPVALAAVAVTFSGIARASAIGIAYAGYALGQAVVPELLTLVPGTYSPGFAAQLIVTAVALVVAWPRSFDLPQPRRGERPFVVGTALWASGIVSVATGLAWIGGGTNPVRIGMIVVGGLLLAAFLAIERWRRIQQPEAVRVERRGVTVALFAGLVIAIAQTVPMAQLPNYFGVILGYGPFLGVLALVPLFLALLAAGPLAGWLLTRRSPRVLVGGGVVAVGLGNLVAAAIIGPSTTYLGFVVPLLVIGGGFVIATTVRTAIIFASVPRGLPATAASLNEASLLIGNRAGILLSTAIVGTVAMATLDAHLGGVDPVAAAAQRDQFAALLAVFGTPSFASLAGAIQPGDAAGYAEAYIAGLRAALLLSGLVAVAGGILAWASLGRRDPLKTMWEHRDERGEVPLEVAAEGLTR
jgi:hypothetical protein